MSFKTTLLATTAALGLTAGIAFAEITNEQIIAAYAGYDRIEIKRGPTQIKVEATKGGMTLEVIYDAATGAILKSETEPADADDAGTGIEIDFEDEDFLDDEDDEDDDEDDEGDDEDDEDDEDDDDEDDDEDDDDDDEDDDDEDDDDEDDEDDDED